MLYFNWQLIGILFAALVTRSVLRSIILVCTGISATLLILTLVFSGSCLDTNASYSQGACVLSLTLQYIYLIFVSVAFATQVIFLFLVRRRTDLAVTFLKNMFIVDIVVAIAFQLSNGLYTPFYGNSNGFDSFYFVNSAKLFTFIALPFYFGIIVRDILDWQYAYSQQGSVKSSAAQVKQNATVPNQVPVSSTFMCLPMPTIRTNPQTAVTPTSQQVAPTPMKQQAPTPPVKSAPIIQKQEEQFKQQPRPVWPPPDME